MWALRLLIPFESCLRAYSARKPSTSVLIELCRDGCGVDISFISHLHFTSLLESLFKVCGLSTCVSHQGAKLCLKLCHTAIATCSHLSCLFICCLDDCFLIIVKGTFQDAATHLWIWSINLRSDFHVHLGEATYLDLYVGYPLAVTLSLAKNFLDVIQRAYLYIVIPSLGRPPSHLSSSEDRRQPLLLFPYLL
jgi:hypothetical protein